MSIQELRDNLMAVESAIFGSLSQQPVNLMTNRSLHSSPSRTGVLTHLLALLVVTVSTSLHSQEIFTIDQLVRSNDMVTIRFTDSRAVIGAHGHILKAAATLTPPIHWTNAVGAVFSSLGNNQYQFIAPALANMSFYRVVDLGLLDSDADGVPDAVEYALKTNPNVPDWITDTDGDGFNDGLEIVNRSNPNDPASRIARGLQPAVTFLQPTSRTLEGIGSHSVRFQFNANYSGKLHYSISPMSTASNGVDFTHPLKGIVQVQNGAGSIPLNIIDDLAVEDIEAIVLFLEDDAAGTYHTGAYSTHSVLLMDNDANWSGLLQSDVGETSFRLSVMRSTVQTNALLIPSPKATANHSGGQLIPTPPSGQSGWALTNLTLTGSSFIGRSVPLPAGSSRLLAQMPFFRTLSFSAVPPPPGVNNVPYLSKTNATFGALFIAGEFTETLAPASPGALQFTNRSNFFLAREAPVMTPLQIPTTPVP